MFFSLFTGNVVLEFVNQFHFTFGLKGWQQKRADHTSFKESIKLAIHVAENKSLPKFQYNTKDQ